MAPSSFPAGDVFSTRLRFSSHGLVHDVEAVYQDTLPGGSSLGTAVLVHGAPGSHNDFKYITPLVAAKGIRVIGTNYPGFGLSQGGQALVDHLKLDRVVFVGHSRATENALMMGAANTSRTVGVVMVNPTGLRIHKGLRPFENLENFVNMYNEAEDDDEKKFLEDGLLEHYKTVGLRPATGRIAAVCVRTMHSVALGKQEADMEAINQCPHVKVLFLYGHDDFLVEPEIPREFSQMIEGRCEMTVKSKEPNEEEQAIRQISEAFTSAGKKAVVVSLEPDGHYMQKHRAALIAEGIVSICEGSSKGQSKL